MWPSLAAACDRKVARMSLVYAIGDIHGSLRKLRTLIARCWRHADGRSATFVFLGDYIDRGPESAGVIRYLIDLQSSLPNRVVTLMGNHEALALAVIDGATPERHVLSQGGAETLLSYGVTDIGALPRDHVDWLRSLRPSYDDGRRFFVHAGIDPRKPLDAQDPDDMLWIREPFLSDRRDFGRLPSLPPNARGRWHFCKPIDVVPRGRAGANAHKAKGRLPRFQHIPEMRQFAAPTYTS